MAEPHVPPETLRDSEHVNPIKTGQSHIFRSPSVWRLVDNEKWSSIPC